LHDCERSFIVGRGTVPARLLKIREKFQCLGHPVTIVSRNNMAGVQQTAGQ
jgi:hypothetical protein